MQAREMVVLAGALGAGLVGAVVALGARNADTQFLQQQRNPPDVQATAVERVVKTAPDPQTGTGAGDSARCTRGDSGPLDNPWRCTVSYGSGRRVRIVARVFQDGSYEGRYEGGGGASGCCIDLPGAR